MACQHRQNGIRRSDTAKFDLRRPADTTLPVPAESERHNTTNTKETAVRHTLRPYATVGVAIVGAGLFTATPVAAPLPDISTFRAVVLAAGESDLLAPWIDQYNSASGEVTKLVNAFFDAPNVGVQQMLANWSGFTQQVLDDPANINPVTQDIQNNLAAVLTGYGLQGANTATTNIVLAHTLDAQGFANGHRQLFIEIPGYIPADAQASAIPIINFLASPASGIIMGEIGPWISPWVAMMNSITDGDDFNTTLANMAGAFFNGADLNLDSLLPTINGLGLFPSGMDMVNLDIGFGGLLSTGSVNPPGSGTPLGEGGVGGSIFNSVGINFIGVPTVGTLNAPSQAIGPLGALEGWAQTIGALLGWDGTGSPLADVTLPTIPSDVLDDGTAAATAGDLSTLWQDLLAALWPAS